MTSHAGLTTIRIRGTIGDATVPEFASAVREALAAPGIKALLIDVFEATLNEPGLAQALTDTQHAAAR